MVLRAINRETSFRFGFYAIGFIALALLGGLGADGQARRALEAIAPLLPEECLFFAVIVLPVAMVSAMLTVIGRMREEGELIALAAAGISTW